MFFSLFNTRLGGSDLDTSTTLKGRRAFRPEGDDLESRQVLSTVVPGGYHFPALITTTSGVVMTLRGLNTTPTVGPGGYHFPALVTTPSGVTMTLRGLSTTPTAPTATKTPLPRTDTSGGYHFPALITTTSGVTMTLRGLNTSH